MDLLPLSRSHTYLASAALCIVAVTTSLVLYLFRKPPFPNNAPPRYTEAYPLLGALQFFTERMDFWNRARSHSKTGNFSFYAGQYPVIGVSGVEERKVFFEHRGLAFAEGYAALLGGIPEVRENNSLTGEQATGDSAFNVFFRKGLTDLTKANQLRRGLPQLLKDARNMLDDIVKNANGLTDPFDSIYRMVFQFTMRTVACDEIGNDPVLVSRFLTNFEAIEQSATPLSIMYHWLPLPSKLKRMYAGAQLYMIVKKVVDEREKTGIRQDDALQYLLDSQKSITEIITFVIGALFAGLLNSGINAAWVVCYLANNDNWMQRVRDEIGQVADRHCPDTSLPLKERLMRIPIEAWEAEFPMIDLCLKESIRLQLKGTAFRKNLTNQDITINKRGEVIPPGAYAALATADIHYDANIYPEPERYDPGRYLPERAEDKKEHYGWMGWGLARHPCAGMKFAKLENNIIVAFFLAYFSDIQLADEMGKPKAEVSRTDLNRHTASKPETPMFLKYKVRQD